MTIRRRNWTEPLMAVVIGCVAVGVTLILLWLVSDLIWQGGAQVNWAFLTTPPEKAGAEGGIAPILVSTALILAVCMAVSTPLGLGTAILLTEFSAQVGPLGRAIRLSLDILAGVPSIVFGLFGNALFSKRLGLGFSILSGGLTLACMVLPILIRSVQEGLQAVPQDYRRSAAALGLSRTAALTTLIIPAAIPGIVVGLLLGIGRAIAETAALIFTSGYVDRMPSSLLDSGRSLSVHIYDLATNIAGGEPHAYATALVLMGALILINGGVSWLAYRFRQLRLQVI
ncbi:MAG: phosphate ABC transporter permease PstA [Thermosynechococcaceae cyanobacterium]